MWSVDNTRRCTLKLSKSQEALSLRSLSLFFPYNLSIWPFSYEVPKATFSPWLLKIGKFTPDSGHFGRSSGAHLRRHSHTCTTFILVPFRRASTTEFAQLPSSFCNFVNLRSLELQKYTDIESLPNSIVNLKLLSKLDCSGCPKLTEIPRHIGRLTSLMELSLRDSGIVNLPESIAHLSSLKSLDLSDCKKLECIPPIPPFLEQLEALDCPSISDVKFSCSKLVKFQRGCIQISFHQCSTTRFRCSC